MCGIAFISPVPGTGLDVVALTNELLAVLTARGRDSAGIAWLDDANETWTVKVPQTGLQLAASLDKNPVMTTGVRSALIHTRWASVGSAHKPENNHPILRHNICLVHNGTLRNARELTDRYKLDRLAEVDSDVLAAIVESKPGGTALPRLGQVKGGAALAWLDARDKGPTVHASRVFGSTLVLGQTADGDTIGCSTETLLRKAANACGVTLDWIHHLGPGSYIAATEGVITDWDRFKVDLNQHWTPPNYTRRSIGRR